jgi:hypothetical protein
MRIARRQIRNNTMATPLARRPEYGGGSHQAVPAVHAWRVTQLRRLGIPAALAELYAGRIDWHQVARLVQRGCPPWLALRIVR